MTIEYDQLAEVYGRYRRCNAEVLRELLNGTGLKHASRVLEALANAAGFNGWRESRVTSSTLLTSAEAYEAKSFSALHLIPEASFQAGITRLRKDLQRGPLMTVGGYVLLWATK